MIVALHNDSSKHDSFDRSSYGGIFDIHKRRWPDTMLEELNIPRDFFPEKILASKDVVGELNGEGAKLTGLNVGTPVCAGGIDALLAGVGTGILESYATINEWLEVTETSLNKRNKELYEKYYRVFKKIYQANEAIFKALHKIA